MKLQRARARVAQVYSERLAEFREQAVAVSTFHELQPTPETAEVWARLTPRRVAGFYLDYWEGVAPWAAPLTRVRRSREAALEARTAIERVLAYGVDQAKLNDDDKLSAEEVGRIAAEIVFTSWMPLLGVVNALRMGSQHRLLNPKGEAIRPYGKLTEGMVYEWLACYGQLLESEIKSQRKARADNRRRREEQERERLKNDPVYQAKLEAARAEALRSIEQLVDTAPMKRTMLDFLREVKK